MKLPFKKTFDRWLVSILFYPAASKGGMTKARLWCGIASPTLVFMTPHTSMKGVSLWIYTTFLLSIILTKAASFCGPLCFPCSTLSHVLLFCSFLSFSSCLRGHITMTASFLFRRRHPLYAFWEPQLQPSLNQSMATLHLQSHSLQNCTLLPPEDHFLVFFLLVPQNGTWITHPEGLPVSLPHFTVVWKSPFLKRK